MDDDEEDDAKPLKGMSMLTNSYLKISLYTFHLILKLWW